jgi:hypothetical protein
MHAAKTGKWKDWSTRRGLRVRRSNCHSNCHGENGEMEGLEHEARLSIIMILGRSQWAYFSNNVAIKMKLFKRSII